MAEFILGIGQQQSVRAVVGMIERHLRRTQGIPRKISVLSDVVNVVAERPEFKGDFICFVLRAYVNGKTVQALQEVVSEYSNECTLEQEEGWVTLQCPPSGKPSTPRVLEAVDKLSLCLKLPEVWRGKGDNYRIDRISPELLFQAMVQYKASDVHLSPGVHPVFRIDGDTHHSELLGVLSSVQILSLLRELAPKNYWDEFESFKQTSFNFHQVGMGYSRISAFIKSGAPHMTIRFLPETIPSFEDLCLPPDTMQNLSNLSHGLLLVTGMTGSGKTTTVASVVDYVNSHKAMHILTIENPIEYVHANKKSIISQRSLGADVATFNDAVTGALRHDPDVIVIGEMRDPDTIRAAINAAATGHLVVSTLHSNTASEVVNRIVSFFDPIERDLVKLQIRDCLRCVICQRLVPRIGGGRMPALEILFNDVKAIGDGITTGDSDLIRIGMQQTVSHSFVFEQYLYRMYKDGKIDLDRAREFATDVSMLDQLLMGTYSIPRLDSIKNKGDHEAFRV
ncbi:MAG TPA: PilT/PilU family type 4a pilus ATPase [Candidatus Hydrogenedentes bacterium]|nr:PilT/PilU family type 4a pilus ATPase [Candidatus Hydrogenedentota bacterium]